MFYSTQTDGLPWAVRRRHYWEPFVLLKQSRSKRGVELLTQQQQQRRRWPKRSKAIGTPAIWSCGGQRSLCFRKHSGLLREEWAAVCCQRKYILNDLMRRIRWARLWSTEEFDLITFSRSLDDFSAPELWMFAFPPGSDLCFSEDAGS